MITQAILEFLHGLAQALATFLGNALPGPPSWIADMTAAFNTAYDMVPGPVKNFLPIGPVAIAGGGLVALIVTLGLVKFARRVLSLFTGGGGNA